jgi:DNA ligase-1
MIFPKLYKYTTLGQVQSWQIFTSGNTYWTEEGINELTKSDPTVCVGKNIGKTNETSPEEQAKLEAQAKWQKKIDKGYNEVLTKEKKFFEPMLAHEYDKYKKLLFTVPTFIQPKLDGVRCYMDDRKLMTRAGKPIVSCEHLIFNFFGLDGELYNHDLKEDFNKIISLVRKTKPTQEDLDESEKLVQFWIYDYPYWKDKVFSERYRMLKSDFNEMYQYNKHLKLVPTYQIKSEKELLEYHEKFISEGYEGSIIRMDLGEYENKRSKQLLKYKNWMDNEFTIIDVSPGTGNRANAANTLSVQLSNGVICKPTMTGTEEYMTQVLKDKDRIIGLQATVKYFGVTPDGNLRFPTVKTIINYIP